SFQVYPGWFDNTEMAGDNERFAFTGTENLVLSLLGRVVKNGETVSGNGMWPSPYDNPDNLEIDLDKVGSGPASNPTADNPFIPADTFWSPKETELFATQGTVGAQNEFPEIIDQFNGLPILYFRADPGRETEIFVASDPANTGLFNRRHALDYLHADTLTDPSGSSWDQSGNSLLANNAAGGWQNANDNLAWVLTDSANNDPGQLRASGFVLIAAGPDGFYFDEFENRNESNTNLIDSHAAVGDFDDVVHRGGNLR
ncbi:MAG: hypothetical protein R3236_02170, partial [Phycisphaeraceae bacterium]|nr:hypothetical protein [Phycisphaeraceae bacterium]